MITLLRYDRFVALKLSYCVIAAIWYSFWWVLHFRKHCYKLYKFVATIPLIPLSMNLVHCYIENVVTMFKFLLLSFSSENVTHLYPCEHSV